MPPELSLEATALAHRARASRRVRATLARENVNVLATHILREDSTGVPVHQAPHLQEWHALADRYPRLIIESGIEHGKTLNLAVIRTLFELGHDPSLRFVFVGATEKQPVRTTSMIGRLIENSADLHEVFPNLRHTDRQWADSGFRVRRPEGDAGDARDPSVQAIGLHGALLSSRVDRMIFDDILTQENTATPHRREDTVSWLRGTALNRLTPRGRAIILTNAWHPEDAVRVLAKEAGWHWVSYPALTEDGTPLWPSQWPAERIEAKRAEIGPLEFARSMMCQPYADEESRFRREWIDLCIANGNGRGLTRALARHPPGYVLVTGVDLAVSRKETAAKTVFFTIAVNTATGTREVLCVEAGRWDVDEILRRAEDTHKRYHSTLYVENNAAQDFLVQILRSRTRVPVRAFRTGRNKRDKTFGVESLAAELARGQWVIPSAGGRVHTSIQEWIDEMVYYSPGSHTGDRLMASWIAREGAREMIGRPGKRTFRADLLSR